MKRRTTFIIAHRLSITRCADRIVALNAGQIVEIGTEQELLARGGLYASFHNAQVTQ
jgi:ABC-type multidrug transport system fused ATPase/permease subunit